MSKATRVASGGTSERLRRALGVWTKSLPRVTAIIIVLVVPGTVWAWRSIQLAGTDTPRLIWGVVVYLGLHAVSGSCIISGMEAARAEKRAWLGRGVRKSMRLLGWELLILLQSAIRTFLPFLPPSATRPEEYQPGKGTAAWWLDRLPFLAGPFHLVSKMGLFPFVAVLTRKPVSECAGLSRGHYLHIALVNLAGLVVQIIAEGMMTGVQEGARQSGRVLPLVSLSVIVLASSVVFSLFTAYGLMLYHDFRREAAR